MNNIELMNIWLDCSVSPTLMGLIAQKPDCFKLVEDPMDADIILFEKDEATYIRKSKEFKRWPQKCVVVSEKDNPTYFLPSCYASNYDCLLSYGRTKTIPYIISQRVIQNPFIQKKDISTPNRYLYSFMGGSTSWVRKKLLKSPLKFDDVYIYDTNHYHHWNFEKSYTDEKLLFQKKYAEMIESSLFILCPRGAGVSSIRLFEVMQAGKVPVIIADKWIPVDYIPWNEFSLRVPEREIINIDDIIRLNKSHADDFGFKSRQAWEKFIEPNMDSLLLASCLMEIQNSRNETREKIIRFIYPVIEIVRLTKIISRKYGKLFILGIFSITGRKFPYSLNRPLEEQIKKN